MSAIRLRPGQVPGVRLFLALWPDAVTRRALAACRDAWVWGPQARPVHAARLHLTLHFLGAVPGDRLRELRRLAVPCPAFELGFGRHALWRNGVAVLGPLEAPSALAELHGALGRALQQLDLPVEHRAWRPHVTLARAAQGSVLPAQQMATLHWRVRDYALVQSLPGGGGYRVLQRFN